MSKVGITSKLLGTLAFLLPLGCSKTDPAASSATANSSASVTKGVWLAASLTDEQKEFILRRTQELGLNTVALNTSYATPEAINAFAREARAVGISTHAWVETGLKTDSLPGSAESSLYLPCGDDGADHGVEKYYLDLTKQAARAKLISEAQKLAAQLVVDAIQYDDHLGYYTSRMKCIHSGNRDALRLGLTQAVNGMIAGIREANPKLKIVFSHHNKGWAREKYLADWTKWKLDGMITQAYVSKSFGTEVSKALSDNVRGMGLHNEDPAIVRNTRKALAAGLSVFYFKFPAVSEGELASVLKGVGGKPNSSVDVPAPVEESPVKGASPSSAREPEQVASENPAAKSPAPMEEEAPVRAGTTQTSASPKEASCVGASPEQVASWMEQCSPANPLNGVLNGKSACELDACRSTGGGYSCATVPYFNRAHFCEQMLPRMK